MRKLCLMLLLFVSVITVGVAVLDTENVAVASLCPPNGRIIAITGTGPTPEHIFSEFPIDKTTDNDSPSSVDTAPPAAKPTRKPLGFVIGQEYEKDGLRYTLDQHGNATIVGCDPSIAILTIPDSIEGHPVIAIGKYAFANDSDKKPYQNLWKIVIPDSVTTIGEGAFQNSKVSDLRLPGGLDRVEDYVFCACDNLERLDLPLSLKNIGIGAFQDCDSLNMVTLPDTLTTIDGWAFINCDRLKTIHIPENVKYIGASAFEDCGALETVALPSGNIKIEVSVFERCERLTVLVAKDSPAHQYAIDNHIPFRLYTTLKVEKNKTTLSVYFSMEPDGRGELVPKNAGTRAFYYPDMGFANDALSSLYIGSDSITVTLYTDSEFSGRSLTLQGKGFYALSLFDFDNICSSYEITR